MVPPGPRKGVARWQAPDQTRNLEIPGSMLAHRPGMTGAQIIRATAGIFLSSTMLPQLSDSVPVNTIANLTKAGSAVT